MITRVVAHLFEAAEYGKVRDRIGEHDVPLQSQPGRNAGHVLFGNADVHELPWKLAGESIDDTESKIRR